MQGSFFECTYSSFVRMYYQKTFDAIIATPISVEEVIAGEILWGATRALINSTAVLAVVAVFGLVSTPLALIDSLASFHGRTNVWLFRNVFHRNIPQHRFFQLPHIPLDNSHVSHQRNVFLTLSTAAGSSNLSLALPLTHVVNITRFLVVGKFPSNLALGIIWIAIATVIFFILSINLMKRRLIK